MLQFIKPSIPLRPFTSKNLTIAILVLTLLIVNFSKTTTTTNKAIYFKAIKATLITITTVINDRNNLNALIDLGDFNAFKTIRLKVVARYVNALVVVLKSTYFKNKRIRKTTLEIATRIVF